MDLGFRIEQAKHIIGNFLVYRTPLHGFEKTLAFLEATLEMLSQNMLTSTKGQAK